MAFPTTVLFPDLSLILTDRLRDALAARGESYAAGVTVSIAIPNPRDDRMVILRLAGGRRLDWPRQMQRVAVQVWAMTEQDVTGLAGLTKALLESLGDGVPIIDVRESAGFARVYDDSGQPLIVFTLDMTVRGSDLT
jgi:hypothetical protein